MTSASQPDPAPQWQRDFLQRHQLRDAYLDSARQWFTPLAQALASHQNSAERPILVALNGCQGSGKTTVCDFLCTALKAEHGLNAVALSLDDFYLTRAQRQSLATSVHPLLATRGVPGTHDMALMQDILGQLLDPQRTDAVAIPRFDKAADDRRPQSAWDRVPAPLQIVLLEGWCLGAQPQPPEQLAQPANALEQAEDPGGDWRGYSNTLLGDAFQALYRLVDQWIMLRAPSFECVFQWRQEQERKLAATVDAAQPNALMDDAALTRFIQHYERLTRQCLDTLPDKVHHLFTLDDRRQITGYTHRPHRGAGL
ncbi:MAG: hypothetical protein KDI17_16715 [Halioglobus sp.]|nr:hypothetical protein [Halioglobus sp.]